MLIKKKLNLIFYFLFFIYFKLLKKRITYFYARRFIYDNFIHFHKFDTQIKYMFQELSFHHNYSQNKTKKYVVTTTRLPLPTITHILNSMRYIFHSLINGGILFSVKNVIIRKIKASFVKTFLEHF